MSYRLYTQPLTEKTGNKAVDGEIIVNTENGHLSIKNNTSIVSATKDIEKELGLQKIILDTLDTILTLIENEVAASEINYVNVNNNTNALLTNLSELENGVSGLFTLVDSLDLTVKDNSFDLYNIYNTLSNLVVSITERESTVMNFSRKVEELTYIEGLLSDYKAKLTTNITTLGTFKNSVESNVDSRATKADYEAWKNSLINTYNNLAVTYGSKIESFTFTHNN